MAKQNDDESVSGERRGRRRNERHSGMHKSATEVPERTMIQTSPSLETNSNNIIVSKT